MTNHVQSNSHVSVDQTEMERIKGQAESTNRMLTKIQTIRGFTSIELLVALSLSIIVLGAIVASLFSQQKVHMTQERLIEMQQDLRSAIYLFGADVKMAGYDPTGNANATFLIADQAEIQFQIDRNGDGDFTDPGPPVTDDPTEVIRYALTNDADRNGIADGAGCDLGRELDTGGLQTLAENIDALNFVYLDQDGNVLATPVANPQAISSVQITLVGRSGKNLPMFFFKNNRNRDYFNRQGTLILAAPNDGFRRISGMHEFKCRNIQLD
jgi:type IV pilus assembly protein PilW